MTDGDRVEEGEGENLPSAGASQKWPQQFKLKLEAQNSLHDTHLYGPKRCHPLLYSGHICRDLDVEQLR